MNVPTLVYQNLELIFYRWVRRLSFFDPAVKPKPLSRIGICSDSPLLKRMDAWLGSQKAGSK